MNNTKKFIFSLLAGATLLTAAPAFADRYDHDRFDRHERFDRSYDHGRHYEHFRGHDRFAYRGYEYRPVIVERPYYYARRPVIVEQPVYYSQPASVYYSQPASGLGIGAMVGQALGSLYDNRQY